LSTITIRNTTGRPALISVAQGSALRADLGIASGGSVAVPTTAAYAVSASITMDDGNTYYSATEWATSASQTVLAQVRQKRGTYTFELVTRPGDTVSAITLSNTCKFPVQFQVKRNGSLGTSVVLENYENAYVSTAHTYTFSGVVDGVTMQPITSGLPKIAVAVVADDDPVADFQSYSLVFR